jgi:hypothetical protein
MPSSKVGKRSFLGLEDEAPTGPSVDSDIQEERIQARRERIAARALAASGWVS